MFEEDGGGEEEEEEDDICCCCVIDAKGSYNPFTQPNKSTLMKPSPPLSKMNER